MAIIKGKHLKGTIGPVVVKQRGTQSIISSTPRHMAQTGATKKSAALYGQVISPLSMKLRKAFSQVSNFYDGTMVNRMNAEIATIIHQHRNDNDSFTFFSDSFNRLIGFEFNQDSQVRNHLLISPTVAITPTTISIDLRGFLVRQNLKFPKGADTCEINFQLVFVGLSEGKYLRNNTETIVVPQSQAWNDPVSFTYPLPQGVICLLSVGLCYMGKVLGRPTCLNEKTFNPVAILGAYYQSGEFNPLDIKGWKKLWVQLAIEDEPLVAARQ